MGDLMKQNGKCGEKPNLQKKKKKKRQVSLATSEMSL